MEPLDRLTDMAHRFLDAWNTHDVDAVLGVYTDDVVYVDPNTDGPVEGAQAMRRYLTRLFDQWEMRWELDELFPLDGGGGAAVRWRATLSARGSDTSVTVTGLDLAVLRGDRLCRNEVYFDRMALLGAPAAAS